MTYGATNPPTVAAADASPTPGYRARIAEAENPELTDPEHAVTVEDVRKLMGASTPHFALQLRNRIAKLIAPLPPEHPARVEGEREIRRLERLAHDGETRGLRPHDGMPHLRSLSADSESQPPAGTSAG